MAEGNREGKLILILGSVASSKTRLLIWYLDTYRYAGKRCVMVKSPLDTRGTEGEVSSRNGDTCPSITTVLSARLFPEKPDPNEYDMVGVDEGQFQPWLYDWCLKWLRLGKTIVIAALDSTWERTPFPNTCDTCDPLRLVPHAHKIKKLRARCVGCQRKAIYSRKITAEEGTVIIGGLEKFVPVCGVCYFKPSLP